MGLCIVVLLTDEHWGAYTDGYNMDSCLKDVQKIIPYAEECGRWFSTIAIDIDKASPCMITEDKVRFDTKHVITDTSQYNIEREESELNIIQGDTNEARKKAHSLTNMQIAEVLLELPHEYAVLAHGDCLINLICDSLILSHPDKHTLIWSLNGRGWRRT